LNENNCLCTPLQLKGSGVLYANIFVFVQQDIVVVLFLRPLKLSLSIPCGSLVPNPLWEVGDAWQLNQEIVKKIKTDTHRWDHVQEEEKYYLNKHNILTGCSLTLFLYRWRKSNLSLMYNEQNGLVLFNIYSKLFNLQNNRWFGILLEAV